MNGLLRQGLGRVNNASAGVIAHAAQVQGQCCVHALRMLRKPDAELMRHLPHYTKLTGLTAFFAFAHHLQNHIVLC